MGPARPQPDHPQAPRSSSLERYVAPTANKHGRRRNTDAYRIPNHEEQPKTSPRQEPRSKGTVEPASSPLRARRTASGQYSLVTPPIEQSEPKLQKNIDPAIIVDRPPPKTVPPILPQTNKETEPPPPKRPIAPPPREAPHTLPNLFGSDLISEKSLDEVILGYLAEDGDSKKDKE
ncbi:MAG: hypothetical protein V1754_11185 [Pseudomonadota bacterium]